MTPIISTQLIEQCRRGDRAAQMEIYSILFRPVYSSALRIVGNPHDAEEIAQESFLKIFRNMDRYTEGLPFVLRRIAINASIDLLRRRRINFVEMSPKYDVSEDEEPTEQVKADVAAIKRAIEKLPTGYRLVITLRLIEDLSFDEIAHEMNISSSTARSQFVRAKQKILEIIKQERQGS